MSPSSDPFYSPASGMDAVPLADDRVLFRSDTHAIQIRGNVAHLLVDRVLPLLDGRRSWTAVAAQLPDVAVADLRAHLDTLVGAGILHCTDDPLEDRAPTLAPLLALIDTLGLPAGQALDRLARLHVVIAGLEGPGAHLAALLARCGVGRLTLVDPYPCQPGNLALLPSVGPDAIGRPRQEIMAAALRQAAGDAPIALELGPAEITRERLAALATECDLLVGCFDRGFTAAQYWLNRASIETGVPAIYAEARGPLGFAGPLVLPGQTACYMCYRMRNVACAPDFTTAMAYEEFLDGQKRPVLHTRAIWPSLAPYLASLLTGEILKLLLGLQRPTLAGKVIEFNGLTLATEAHPVLQQPDCPVCQVKKKWRRPHPPLAELIRSPAPAGDVLTVGSQLLSPRTGIIQAAGLYVKDAGEPVLPYIYYVDLANHHFRTKDEALDMNCSGKGLTLPAARASALGEAVERYSSDWLDPAEIVYARRGDLAGPSLDPRDLVLYAPEQYAQLPYAPYDDATPLGWAQGRSLVTGAAIFIPALAIFMGYQARTPAEYLFPATSNGLAAGATLAGAILAATYEVLERDAFMITWFNQLPALRIDPATHPDAAIRDFCAAYARRHVDLLLYRLPVDHPCTVFLALASQQPGNTGPAVIAGLGASLDPAVAARKALLEVGQIRPSYRQSLRRPDTRARMADLVADPGRVNDMHDHGLLYSSPALRPALAFLLDRPLSASDWTSQETGSVTGDLQRLVADCQATGRDLLYYNLTPPDMAGLGLHTARAILPGCQPIAFGAQEPRLGGSRLYDLPLRLGFRTARPTLADLNPYPHP